MSQREKDRKKKQQESTLEKMVFDIIEKSTEQALKQALDELFKDWQ